jgi:hypothetical protein
MKGSEKVRRQIFVLTPEEKKAIACVVAAFVLGIGTKHYRATHPRPAPAPTVREQYLAKRTAKAEAARARSARGQAGAVSPTPTSGETDED